MRHGSVSSLQYQPDMGIGPNAIEDARPTVMSPPASPLRLEPLPRNVWQVMPRWHIRALVVCFSLYFLVLAILVSSCFYLLFAVEDLKDKCNDSVVAYLITFVCVATSLLVLGVTLLALFAAKLVPRFLKSAKPIHDGWHCYGIVTGFLVFATFACSVFGLYAAPFKDRQLEAQCRLPVRIIQGVSITFLAMTLLTLIGIFAHRRVLNARLNRIQKDHCRPHLPPMPGTVGGEHIFY